MTSQRHTLSVLTTEYVHVDVRPRVVGQDPTSGDVQLAFIAGIDTSVRPTDDDWVDGSWEPDATAPYVARALVGPDGDTELAVGKYTVWAHITAEPEDIIRPAPGLIVVK